MSRSLFFRLTLAATLLAADAFAEPDACATIASATDRLACYDRYFGTPVDSSLENPADLSGRGSAPKDEPDRATPIVQSEGLAEVSVTSDAAALPTEAAAGAPAAAESPPANLKPGFFSRERIRVESKIAAVRSDYQQKMVFRLENGQIWLQSTARELPIREGDQVTVASATVGGYILSTPQGVSTRVQRIR